MVKVSYNRVRKTSSKTGVERMIGRKIKKQLKGGLVPDQTLPVRCPPRRKGLRGVRYEYAHNSPPKFVYQTLPEAPEDEGSSNIKGPIQGASGSDPRLQLWAVGTPLPQIPNTAPIVPPAEDDETASQAPTAIDDNDKNLSSFSDYGEDGKDNAVQNLDKSEEGGDRTVADKGKGKAGSANSHCNAKAHSSSGAENNTGVTAPSCNLASTFPSQHTLSKHAELECFKPSLHVFGPSSTSYNNFDLAPLSAEDALFLAGSFPHYNNDFGFSTPDNSALGLTLTASDPAFPCSIGQQGIFATNASSDFAPLYDSFAPPVSGSGHASIPDLTPSFTPSAPLIEQVDTRVSMGPVQSDNTIDIASQAQPYGSGSSGSLLNPTPEFHTSPNRWTPAPPPRSRGLQIDASTRQLHSPAVLRASTPGLSGPSIKPLLDPHPSGPSPSTPLAPFHSPNSAVQHNGALCLGKSQNPSCSGSTQYPSSTHPRGVSIGPIEAASSPAAARRAAPFRSASNLPASICLSSTPNTPSPRLLPLLTQKRSYAQLSAPVSRLASPFPSTPSPLINSPIASPRTPLFSNLDFEANGTTSPLLRERSPDLTGRLDNASDGGYRGYRQRSPPPLAQARTTDLPNALDDNNNGQPEASTDQGSPPGNVRQAAPIATSILTSTPVILAPTSVEFSERRAKELRALRSARKSKPKKKQGKKQGSGDDRDSSDGEGAGQSVRAIGEYTRDEQELVFVFRAILQYYYVSRGPWLDDDAALDSAKGFIKLHTKFDVDTMLSDEMRDTMRTMHSQLRAAGQDRIKTVVQAHFNVCVGDIQALSYLQERHRCLYPHGNMVRKDLLYTDLVANVLGILFFGTSRRFGYLFLDELLQDDNPQELERLLLSVARPRSGNTLEIPIIQDCTPEAQRGPSLAAIAFAGVNIYHALERLKVPSTEKGTKAAKSKKGFTEVNYGYIWSHYVRELAANPRLGDLRSAYLDRLKEEFCKDFNRAGPPAGTDHLW
ncbi:cardiomyopathy-associated protein 5 [Ceratobasidium sp. AG-Ba]|nr:cardiomyopathy-associated protein 5 [Ceratobasidium sp. AG-Ba]